MNGHQPTFNGEIIRFSHHLMTIKNNLIGIMLFTFFFTLASTWFIYSMPSVYKATAILLIQEQQKSALSVDEIYGVDTTQKEYFQTQIAILKSNHIALKVIEEMTLEQRDEFSSSSSLKLKINELKSIPFIQDLLGVVPSPIGTAQYERKYYTALNNFRNKLTIEPIRNTQLVRIEFNSVDPELAARIANTVGKAYIESNFEAKLVVTQNATNWLTDNASKLEQKLRESEQTLQDYLLQEGLIDINGIDEIYARELETLSRRLSEVRNNRIEAQTQAALLQTKSARDIDSLLSMDEFANQAQIRDLKLAEIQSEKKVTELSQRYGPKHDKMIQAYAQLKAIQEKAQQKIREIAYSKQQDLNSAINQERLLMAEVESKRGQFQVLGGQRAKYEQLRREVESNKQLYEALLNREKETDATSDYNNVTARFTDKAMVPLFPFAPKRIKLVAISSFIGFAIICLSVIALEIIRNTIANYKDVEEKLGVTCLGVLPFIKERRLKKEGVGYTSYKDDKGAVAYSEACRSARTSLLLSLSNRNQKCIAFTSALPSEGKTATAINLATSLASMERVVIVDCDLRKPSLAKRFGIERSIPGLNQVLSMNTPLEECLVCHDEANLTVLTAGISTPNAQELLQSSQFTSLIEMLSDQFDRIILDTPPLLSVSDALIVGKLSQGLVTVVKAESTKTTLVNYALTKQLQHGIPSLGVLVNQAKNINRGYLYEQKYAYNS